MYNKKEIHFLSACSFSSIVLRLNISKTVYFNMFAANKQKPFQWSLHRHCTLHLHPKTTATKTATWKWWGSVKFVACERLICSSLIYNFFRSCSPADNNSFSFLPCIQSEKWIQWNFQCNGKPNRWNAINSFVKCRILPTHARQVVYVLACICTYIDVNKSTKKGRKRRKRKKKVLQKTREI